MRISDWSSDVCSSDLSCCWRWKARNSSNPQSPIPNAMTEAKRLAAEKAIEFVEDGMIVGVGTGSTVAWFIDALARDPARTPNWRRENWPRRTQEIGRASCRERVCQYVWI